MDALSMLNSNQCHNETGTNGHEPVRCTIHTAFKILLQGIIT